MLLQLSQKLKQAGIDKKHLPANLCTPGLVKSILENKLPDVAAALTEAGIDKNHRPTILSACARGKGLVCERRVARRRGARARRSVRVNPIPHLDPNPNQAPQMSLKE